MRLNTSPSRPSSRTSVAVSPAATRLQVGGELEDRCGKQMHLVVDDEAPVQRIQEREVRVLAFPLRREDLIGRDGDRLDLLGLTRVLADLLGGQRRALEQLVAPLARADGVGDEDEVVVFVAAIAAAPTSVLPAPQGARRHPSRPR
jgi:hypothetical protein